MSEAEARTPAVQPADAGRGRRTRQRLPRGMIVVGIILGAMVGYALYAGVAALQQHPVVGTVSRYQVTSSTKVTYQMTITGQAGTNVICTVVARGSDYSIVGQVELKARITSAGDAGIAGTITTVGRASDAEAGTCQLR